MLKRRLVVLCVLVAGAFGVPVGAAVAQAPGVTVDPGSPTGKEYALPVQRARQQAAKTNKQQTSTSPLFGEGVNDAKTGGTAPSTTTTATTPQSTGSGSSKSRRDAARKAAAIAAAARAKAAAAQSEAAHQLQIERARQLKAQASTPDGGIGVGGIIGLGVAVLLVGGLIGLWLRRRSASTAP